jgi:hypothetical protein
MSTSLDIFVCTLTSCVSFGVWGLDLILTTIWVSYVTNGASVIITIDRGIATEYNDTNLIGSILKLKVIR